MFVGSRRAPTVLTEAQLAAFRRRGYVRVKGAFPRELALIMQAEIWAEIRAEHGIERDDPATWRPLPRSPRGTKHLARNAELASARFAGVISDLVGRDDWPRPASWGGFLVTFPGAPGARWELPADQWHWDGIPGGDGLVIFSFYSDVRARGGGTLLLPGSPRLIADYYGSLSPAERALPHKAHRKRFSRWSPWLAALTGRTREPVEDRGAAFMRRTTDVRGVPYRIVELVGEPGDAVFCDLGMLHSPAPNARAEPRFMRSKFLFLDDGARV